jgi:GDP-6-deoxy-D-talose 4-dehydrogenase
VGPISDNRRALITGIRGFTGEYVASQLRELGFRVYGTCFQEQEQDEFVERLDLRDINGTFSYVQSIQPDVVVHLAAVSFVAHESAQEIYDVNINGTRNLLQGLSSLSRSPKSVILASSANIYGNSSSDPITEDSNIVPENDYAVSKYAMELMSRAWRNKFPITIVRPFNYTGRGQSTRFLIPKMVEALVAKRKEIELGNLDVERDFSDVRTVAWVYAQLALNPAAGKVFNIASGNSVSLTEILLKLCELAGHQIEVKSTEVLRRTGEVSRLRGDASLLWSHIGKPPSISLEDTLTWMLER